jgi:ERCC4-related helicase
VRTFSRALDDLYSGNTGRSPDVVAERLAEKASAAVEAMAAFVIRHGVDDLPAERHSFGTREDWSIAVPQAMRMDRALRVASQEEALSDRARNDPRFHVGWRHYDEERRRLRRDATRLPEPAKAVVESHLAAMGRLRKEVGLLHSKILAVADEVKKVIERGEKVLLFCHHHATAQELAACLHTILPAITTQRAPGPKIWESAWDVALGPALDDGGEQTLRRTFVRWLCSDLVRTQTWSWLGASSATLSELADALKTCRARQREGAEFVSEAARRLYNLLVQSKSSRAVLKEAADRIDLLPGANGASRVLAVCEPSENEKEAGLFIHNRQPDTVISVFNSPFGPDVLVVTDKLSEGIDLHRYCRHLVHYELDPSPIRTVQRNGRLRRVNSWAAIAGRPICYAYPAFRGTRETRNI